MVAIDYGTTNTGLAMLHITSAAPRVSDVNVFTGWPKFSTTKVPSVISYGPTHTGSKQWGHDVCDGSEIMRWTKLELRPLNRAGELERLLETARYLPVSTSIRNGVSDMAKDQSLVPMYLGLSPTDVVADFLKKVARLWFETMEKQSRATLQNVPLDLVVTHPGVWSYEAKNQTVQAVRRAFSENLFPTLRDIALCTEPEACAAYTTLAASAMDRCRLQKVSCCYVELSWGFLMWPLTEVRFMLCRKIAL